MTYSEFLNSFIGKLVEIRSFAERIRFADENLTRIGSGSGRIVYDIDGNKVLKLAKNPKGVAQNEVESSIGQYSDTQHVVAKVFETSNDDAWLIAEKAKKVTPNRIKQLTGIPSLSELGYYLRNEKERINGKREISNLDPNTKEVLTNNEFVIDLLEFVNNYNQSTGDLGRPSSYGEVLHDGQPSIVLTDYGLNDEVYATHYSPDRNKRNYMYELYNFADGNDDMLSDIGNAGEIKHGMWALIPQGVGDGDVPINEEFIKFVENNANKYPNKPISKLPELVDMFNECVDNVHKTLNNVKNKKRFYEGLLSLQEYLISQKVYNKEELRKEEYVITEETNTPSVKAFSLDDKTYATKLAKSIAEKLGLRIVNYLGGGSNGFAFDIGGGKILKISADIGEADAAAKLLRANPKYIAKVYNLYKIFDSEKNLSFYSIIEENVEDKPVDKFKRYSNVINTIMPNGMSLTDFYISMMKKFDFNNLIELGKGILTDKPELNISNSERNEAYNYLLGLLNIKKELVSLGINKSNDYSNVENIGYDNGVLKYFDFGGYRGSEPDLGSNGVISLPENVNVSQDSFNRENATIIADKIATMVNLESPRFIGSGEHGFAFDVGGDKVLKITTDKTEAVEGLKVKGKNLKHLANTFGVYEVTSKTNSIGLPIFAIVGEKLATNKVYFDKMVGRLNYVFDKILGLDFYHVLDDYVYGEYDENKVNIDKYLSKNPEDAKFYYNLLGIADEAHKFGIESVDYYNTSNLGYKKDGSLGFFDMGFGDTVFKSHSKPEKIEVDEDGSSKFSTINSIGRDDLPTYNQNDTSPSIDNNIPTSVDDIVERVLSSIQGSSEVNVKKKCMLAGNGNTSSACNQGDINNLNMTKLK